MTGSPERDGYVEVAPGVWVKGLPTEPCPCGCGRYLACPTREQLVRYAEIGRPIVERMLERQRREQHANPVQRQGDRVPASA